MVKTSYSRRSQVFELHEPILKMARIPVGSTPMQNPVSSAQAILIIIDSNRVNTSRIFCLPGVQAELEAIFPEQILSKIKKKVGDFFQDEVNFGIAGVLELKIAPVLLDIVKVNQKDLSI